MGQTEAESPAHFSRIQEGIWSSIQMNIIGFIVNTSCYLTTVCAHIMYYKYILLMFIFACNAILFYTYSIEYSGSQ